MEIIKSSEILEIMQRTLNCIDSRLVNHGKRVSYLVLKILEAYGLDDSKELHNIAVVALLHDIGAYKTEEIDQMVLFENSNMWEHSVYGYLFLNYFSPLAKYAPVILFHHTDFEKLKQVNVPMREFAQMVNIADRMEIYFETNPQYDLFDYLDQNQDTKFMPELVTLLRELEKREHLLEALQTGAYESEWEQKFCQVHFTEEEIFSFLQTIIFAIDFRSQHTVTHTITTSGISLELSRRLGQNSEEARKVYYGALLHDLGKVAMPVEILEFPGKLSPQAMKIMQTHVCVTEEILGNSIPDEVRQISLRHHEKLDGSGYPRGLTGEELTLSQRIVAVADIVSALTGTRSYKDKFSKDKTIRILLAMRDKGLVCPVVTNKMMEEFDAIMSSVKKYCEPILLTYNGIHDDYINLLTSCRNIQRL